MKELADIIKDWIITLGFPIAVTIFLLWKYEKVLNKMSENIGKLSKTMAEIAGYIKGVKDGK
jgi:hypothetical protein